MVSSNTFTVSKGSEVSRLNGANVRFYGEELCVAVTKYTEVEQNDGTTKSSSVCLKSCLSVGGATRLDTYSGTFGRPSSTNPPCCYSGLIKYLRFSIPAPPTTPPPSYQCIECSDCDGAGTRISTITCNAGEKCFTLKLQKHQDGEVVTVKGCSHHLRNWGKNLYCEDQPECKSNVRLWPDESRHYSVCVSCCSGDKCNGKKSVGSGVSFYGHNRHMMILALIFGVFVISWRNWHWSHITRFPGRVKRVYKSCKQSFGNQMMLNYKSYKAFMSDQLRTINNNSFSYSEISYFYKAYI